MRTPENTGSRRIAQAGWARYRLHVVKKGPDMPEIAVNGTSLHVDDTGSGPALVLVHGWPEWGETWRPLMERLRDRFRVVVPDLRGFGRSAVADTPPSDQVGADRHADDLVAVLDALRIAQAGFVGHDVGAYVLQRIGLRHPGRATGLFFLNCPTAHVGPRLREPRQIPEIWYQTFHQMPFAAAQVGATRESCRAYIGHFLRHWSHDPAWVAPVLEAWVDNFMRPGALQGGFNWYLSNNAGRLATMAGTIEPPPPIAVPARILWGRHDPVLRSDWAECARAAFQQVEIGYAEGSGHFVHREEPALAAREIIRFFDTSQVTKN